MERLTWRVNGEARIMLNSIEICGTVADRLAAIEDILGDEYDLERLKELIKQTGGAKPMRLIDADAIKINYGGLAHIGPYDYEEISKYYLDQIKKQPTVDAVPVVRCRECEYYDENGDCISLDLRIGIHSDTINYDFCPDPDFYCAYGRRKIETVLPKSAEKDESLEETHANARKNAR